MANRKKINILGAGLAGMVAAINLARKGHDVLVIEAGKQLGGIKSIHPSVHVTPIDKGLYSYIGIDLRKSIPLVRDGGYYIKLNGSSISLTFPGDMFYLVERSARETSLDSILYQEALKSGVRFEFSNFVERIDDLPPGSIVATGLHPENFESMKIPYVKVIGYAARGKYRDKKFDRHALSWFGDYTRDYGYAGFVNDLAYILVFSTEGKEKLNLDKFRQHMKDSSGLEFNKWDYFEGAVPIRSPSNLRLFYKDKILAGTISAMMDPALLFGIHGALVSGKIAAMAVDDRAGALREFKRVNRYFKRTLRMRRFGEIFLMRFRSLLIKQMVQFPLLSLPLMMLSGRGIPGYNKNWMLESISTGLKEVECATHNC